MILHDLYMFSRMKHMACSQWFKMISTLWLGGALCCLTLLPGQFPILHRTTAKTQMSQEFRTETSNRLFYLPLPGLLEAKTLLNSIKQEGNCRV